MALIAVISSVSILSMAYYIPNVRLKSVAQDLDIQIQRARLEAIRRSRPVAVRFFTPDLIGTQKYGPIVWIDENYDSSNGAHPLLETGEEVLFRMPVNEVGANIWESVATKGVRFNHDKSARHLQNGHAP